MMDMLLQAGGGFSVSAPDQTQGQFYIAIGVMLVLALGTIAIRIRSNYVGLDGDQADHKRDLRRAKYGQQPRTLRFGRGADLRDEYGRIREFCTDGGEPDQDRPTLSSAAVEIYREAALLFGARFENVPQFTRRLGVLGVWVIVTGALAVSTGAIVQLLQSGGSLGLQPATWPQKALVETISFLALYGQFAGMVPGGSLLFQGVRSLFELLYQHWYVPGGGLVLAAAAGWWLDDRTDVDLRLRVPLPAPRRVLRDVAFGTAAVWAGVLVVTGIGRIADAATAARLLAVAVGLVGSVALLVLGAYRAWQATLVLRGWDGRLAMESTEAQAYIVTRVVGIGLAVLVAPLVPVWTVVGLSKLPVVIGGIAAAPAPVKVLAATVLLVAIAALLYGLRGAWPTVRSALREVTGRASLAAVAIRRGVPLATGALAYLIVWSFTNQVLLSISAALFGVVVGYGLYWALEAALYKLGGLDFGNDRDRSVRLAAYDLPDADGNRHTLVEVNGDYRLAREDPGALADAVVTVGEAVQQRQDPDPCLAQWYASDLLELGLVDEARSLGDRRLLALVDDGYAVAAGEGEPGRAWEHARKRLVNELRPVGSATDRDDLKDAQEDVPTPFYEAWEERLRRIGLLVERGDVLRLERDPWQELGEQQR
jgi:hypothetical protein